MSSATQRQFNSAAQVLPRRQLVAVVQLFAA